MDIKKRKEKAEQLHQEGYNCSQSVLMACADKLGITEAQGAVIGSGLGAGVAIGEICGVANALAIGAGLLAADPSASGKKSVMPRVREMCRKFSEPYGGRITCRELKGQCGRSCDQLIAEGVEILSDHMENNHSLARISAE